MTFFRILGLRLISGRRNMGLSLFSILESLITMLLLDVVLVFLGRRKVTFRTPGINLPKVGGGLQVGLCFCITCLLYHFFPRV